LFQAASVAGLLGLALDLLAGFDHEQMLAR